MFHLEKTAAELNENKTNLMRFWHIKIIETVK